MTEKVINDPIHGMIELSELAIKVIDTPIFQRLRNLKQLGLCYLVFPGAEHTRFSHSIGVYHLAKTQMKFLQTQQPELAITDHEVELVAIGGLCHDLGHGPFSHTFEKWVKIQGADFEHERMSTALVEYLLADTLSPEEITMIQNIINFEENYCVLENRHFLFEIVCNNNTSIDVDKFDYILRDSHFAGKKYNIDPYLFIHSTKVIDGHLCYNQKMAHELYNLFASRYNLFREIYMHKAVVGIEFLVLELFDELDKEMDIIGHLQNIDEYCKLTDIIFTSIPLLYDRSTKIYQLYNRIICRDLYKCVINCNQKYILDHITTFDSAYICQKCDISPEEFIVHVFPINFSMKAKNPMKDVLFYDKSNSNRSFRLPKKYISALLPTVYQEYFVRVYVKDKNDITLIQKIKNLLNN